MSSISLLNDIKIKTAKTKEKKYLLSDGGGLYLQILPNSKRIWIFKFTFNGKRRETTFKSYPAISLKHARNKRDEYNKLILNGTDPINYFKAKKQKEIFENENSFEKILYLWLENEEHKSKKEHSRKKRLFEKDVLPFFKTKSLRDITIQDLIKVLKNKDKKAPNIADKMYGYLKNFYGFSVLEGYCERNLLNEFTKAQVLNKRTVRHMAKITDQEIFKELINAIYSYRGTFSIRNALKLVLHLPLRAENLCTLKWGEIDFERKLIVISREKMKFKDVNLDDFIIPLTNEVINILKEQKDELQNFTNEFDYVFVGNNHKDHINKESPNNALQIMSFNDDKKGRKIRLHGFRGTFRSLIDTLDTDSKFSFEVKERVLDHHERSKSVRAYSHKSDFRQHLKEVMNFWSDYILSLKD